MNQAVLAQQINNLQLVPQPERFTELYFVNYDQLHSALRIGDVQTIIFTVSNFEHRPTTYQYKLAALSNDGHQEQLFTEDSFTLKHNSSRTATQTIRIPRLDTHIKMQLSLQYMAIAFGDSEPSLQRQSIDYWVNVTDSKSKKQ